MTTTLTRWTPETDLIRSRLDRMFNQMLQDSWGAQLPSEEMTSRAWSPTVDVKETGDTLEFMVELPGLSKDDIEITLENNVLTLSGERKFEKEAKGETYHRMERSYGAFSRSFTLPASFRTDKVDANFAEGVLHIRLPKMEASKPRKISIR